MATQCIQASTADASGPKARQLAKSAATAASAGPAGEVKMSDAFKAIETAPRTPEVMMAEVRYGIVFGEMNEVFNGRIHRFLSFLWISAAALSGGSLVTLLNKAAPEIVLPWTIGLGVIAALAASAQKAFKFHEKEEKYRAAKAAFQELEGKGWSMAHGTLQKELAKLLAKAPSGGTWLAALAYNRACRELGHPEVQMPVSGPVKFAAGLVA